MTVISNKTFLTSEASSSQLNKENEVNIIDIRHPDYYANLSKWSFYRATLESGHDFVDNYLVKFSTREDDNDFYARKQLSYCPAHAKAALLEIKNAIYQRMVDINREGGPASYQQAVAGENYGVDLANRTMTAFIGDQVLRDL